MVGTEDHSFVRPVSHTDEEIFSEFFRSHYQRALSLARFRTKTSDYEALVEDAFLVAWQHFSKTGELTTAWFFGVLRNKIGDFYRSPLSKVTPVEALPADQANDVDMTERTVSRLDVQRVLHSLPAAYSEPLVLVYWCDLTARQAAQALGLREGAFRMKLHRAKQAFSAEYGRRYSTRDGGTTWMTQND